MRRGFIESADDWPQAHILKDAWEKMLKGMGLADEYKIVAKEYWLNKSFPDHGRAVAGRRGGRAVGLFVDKKTKAETEKAQAI